MKTDENQFFKEMTLRICGSLEIEKALWQCFRYVHEVMPADELILTVYDPAAGVLEVVATANQSGGISGTDKIPMPPHLQRQLEEPLKFPRVRASEDVYSDEIFAVVAERHGWADSSIMVARLIIQDKFVGSFIVRANGKGRYTEAEAKLWSLINEPAAVALANSRRYLELMQLKELLADDSKYFQNELRRGFSEAIVGAEFGRDPDRVPKIEPEHTHRKPPVVARGRRQRSELQEPDRKPMRIFRIERAQQRARQAVEQADHGCNSGSARRPPASSGNARAQRTALSGSAP